MVCLRGGAMETEILDELLRPYANVIEINGEIPLAKLVLDYLLQELPDTTKLVNHFKKTDYRAYFTKSDRSAFYATNGRKMHATIAYIDKIESPAHSSHLMFEDGRAKILLWRFAGKSVVEIELDERGQATNFGVRLHIFSNSRNFHLFFKSALFKSIVRSMFKRFIADIVKATHRFADAEEDYAADNPAFIEGLKRRLR